MSTDTPSTRALLKPLAVVGILALVVTALAISPAAVERPSAMHSRLWKDWPRPQPCITGCGNPGRYVRLGQEATEPWPVVGGDPRRCAVGC